MNLPGFTIIELLVVITIIAILTGISIPVFGSYLETQQLRQAQDQVVVDLRKIQNRALSSVGFIPSYTTHWGVVFREDAGTYHYFLVNTDIGTNLNNVCTAAINSVGTNSPVVLEEAAPLPEGLVIRSGNSPFCIFYDFAKGNKQASSSAPANIVVGRPGGGAAECARINLSNVGLISSHQPLVDCL